MNAPMDDLSDRDLRDLCLMYVWSDRGDNHWVRRALAELSRRREADRWRPDWFWIDDDPETAAGDLEGLVDRLWSEGLGDSVVFKAGREMEKLAESQLDGTVIASPAIVGDAIFLRTDTHLYRIENR